MNILSKFQVPNSYGLGVKVSLRYFHNGWVTEWICRTAPATPGLLKIVTCFYFHLQLFFFFFFSDYPRVIHCYIQGFSCGLRLPSVMLKLPPPGFWKRGGMESSGQRLISLNGKTKKKYIYILGVLNTYSNFQLLIFLDVKKKIMIKKRFFDSF